MSLRYILIITKCLSELNIRNNNLLTSLLERVTKLIENDKKNPIKDHNNDNFIDTNSIAQILTNFVKLEFLDYEGYKTLEELFFEKSKLNPEIMNKETLFSIFYAHCVFYKKFFITYKKNASEKNKSNDNNEDSNRENDRLSKKKNSKNHKFYKGLQ